MARELKSTFVYIIGLGGAGKSSSGRIVADIMGWTAIDIDEEFCYRIMNIRDFIKKYNYEKYVEKNSLLLRQLLIERVGLNTIFILSSGFLSTDVCCNIVQENRRVIKETGLSVLLMPSLDYDISLKCIISRQLKREMSLNVVSETRKFQQRFSEYIRMGDIKIFSMECPDNIARKIVMEIESCIKIN